MPRVIPTGSAADAPPGRIPGAVPAMRSATPMVTAHIRRAIVNPPSMGRSVRPRLVGSSGRASASTNRLGADPRWPPRCVIRRPGPSAPPS
jgi:hypothetical protein